MTWLFSNTFFCLSSNWEAVNDILNEKISVPLIIVVLGSQWTSEMEAVVLKFCDLIAHYVISDHVIADANLITLTAFI